jgi:uncharacterized protein HemX
MLDFLKTMPDMTNTPEITMYEEAPKIPMAKRIRDYKAANPNATAKQIAEAVGTTAVYVYQTLATPLKKEKKVTAVKKKTETPPASEKPVNKKEHQNLADDNEVKGMIIEAQYERIKNLLVIVEYLEEKIEALNESKYS